MENKRVLVIDSEVFVTGVQCFLNGHCEVRSVSRVKELAAVLDEYRPHLVITETRLGGERFLALKHVLPAARALSIPVLVFTNECDEVRLAAALAEGAAGYLSKTIDTEVFQRAVQSLLLTGKMGPDSGDLLPTVRAALARTDAIEELTPRQSQVGRCIAMGLSNQRIAALLRISIDTTKEHVQGLMRRLNLADRTQVAIWFYRKLAS